VEHHRAAGGIVLTASHNPIEWNALKFVGPDGIFLDAEGGARVVTLAADGRLERAGFGTLGDVATDAAATARHLAAVLRLRAVDDAARECGATVIRAPVGEANVARAMLAARAPVGGEGNGGVMLPTLHVGRDGPVAAALALTLLARTGKTVSELVAAAPRYVIVKAKIDRGRGKGEGGMTDV